MDYDEILDEDITRIESISALRCPAESRRNAYTKACWLLAKYKAVLPIVGSEKERSNGIRAIAAIKELLPKLRGGR